MNKSCSIYEIADINQSSLTSKDNYEYINYLDTSNLTRNKIDSIQYIDKDFPSRAKRKVKADTIIYSTVRPNQEHFGIIENYNIKNLIVSTGFTTIDVKSHEIDHKYLYYKLTNPSVTNYLQTIAENSVSAYPSIKPEEIGNLRFKFPALEAQRNVAAVLSALDDKIELNNRINEQLEALAKTLYDYWFVQFDFPNNDGKPYKSSGGEMVYSEVLKREIPKGWVVKKLSEIANITMGQSPSGESLNEADEGMIFFQGSTDFGWRYPENRVFTTMPTRLAKENDVLLSVRAPIGALNIAMHDCCIGRGVAALHSKNGFNSYLTYLMNHFKKKFEYLNSVGTTFGSLTKDDLYGLEHVYPEESVLRSFEIKVSVIDMKIKNNTKQNQQLAQLRDWLLPMLMNGQVTVGEAEEMVEGLGMVAEERTRYD